MTQPYSIHDDYILEMMSLVTGLKVLSNFVSAIINISTVFVVFETNNKTTSDCESSTPEFDYVPLTPNTSAVNIEFETDVNNDILFLQNQLSVDIERLLYSPTVISMHFI
jgi:hypothetical protein